MINRIGDRLFNQICMHFYKHISKLDDTTLQIFLNVLGNSNFNVTEFKREGLAVFEKRITDEISKFYNYDIPTIISSFLRLGYVPREIIKEILQLS